MRTRSSSCNDLLSPLSNPDRILCNLSRRVVDSISPTIFMPGVAENNQQDGEMADTRPMSKLLQAPTEGVGDAIVVPAIIADQFELKIGLLNLIDTFYNGLTQFDQDSLNAAAGGNLLNRNTREALTIIESKSKVRTSKNKPIVSSASSLSQSELSALTEAIKALVLSNNKPQPPPAPVKAVNESCFTYGDPHPYYECTASGGFTNEDIQASMANQANIMQNMFSQFLKSQQESKPSGSGLLPSDTIPNPCEQVHAVTTRSGSTAYVPPPKSYAPIFDEIRKPKAKKDINDESQEPNPHQPRIFYPSRLNVAKASDRSDAQMSRFVKMFTQLLFDIGLSDALFEMPKFNKWLSALLKNKDILEEIANTLVNVECSAIILNKVPKKLGDPNKFLIPCSLQDLVVCNSLANSEASINLLPLSIYEQLALGALKPTQTSDSSIDKFADELTLLDSFPSDFEDDLVFERFTFEPTPVDPSPLGDVDVDYLLDDEPFERFTFNLSLIDSVTPSQDLIPISPTLPPFDINFVYEEFADELALLDPFPSGNEDVCFDPGAVCDEIEFLLYHDPSSPKMTIDFILEGFTDKPPLGENDDDDLFDLSTRNDEWRKLLYDVPFNDTKSFDLIIFMDDVFLTPALTYDLSFYGVSSGDDTLLSFSFSPEDKLFDSGIHEPWKSRTFTNAINERTFLRIHEIVPFDNPHFLSLPYAHGLIFLLELPDVDHFLPFYVENEDTIFDPGIIAFIGMYSLIPGSSHRSGTFIYILLNIFYESLMMIVSSTCFPKD
ncbi:hypothetical protein Tco_0548291 [Tanacetum coccineum]